MGNTVPSLASQALRLVLVALPVLALSGRPGVSLSWIWSFSAASVGVQFVVGLLLLRHEFQVPLAFDGAEAEGRAWPRRRPARMRRRAW